MNKPAVKPQLFRYALYKSERLRLLIVMGVIAFIVLERTIRTMIQPGTENFRVLLLTAVFGTCFVALELLMLRAVNLALQGGPDLPRIAWTGDTVMETALPAFVLAFLTSPAIDYPYRALANPAVFGFFLFIVLSTLRLNPKNCMLTGFSSTVFYLLAALNLGWRPSLDPEISIFAPQRAVISFAIAFLIGGFVAAAVAREIRKHVEAELHEAEIQREVERLEHDLKVARSIQQSLLPNSVPEVEGFEIAGWNQPADETGGDYYDWHVLPGGRFLVVLADVTGHGIGSALLAAVCRAYARASFSVEQELLPAMERINAQLSADLTGGLFVTFVAVICAPGESHVRLLSAGHGPLFFYLLREDQFNKSNAQGLPLGISPTLDSEPPLTVELNLGDMIVLLTDGFSEWVNAAKEQFGADRLENAIREARDLPPTEIISTLYRKVVEFSGGTKQLDDLTAVIIKRKKL